MSTPYPAIRVRSVEPNTSWPARAHDRFRNQREAGSIGRTLNHYKIVAEIGKGGMGQVYRAEDTRWPAPIRCTNGYDHSTAVLNSIASGARGLVRMITRRRRDLPVPCT